MISIRIEIIPKVKRRKTTQWPQWNCMQPCENNLLAYILNFSAFSNHLILGCIS